MPHSDNARSYRKHFLPLESNPNLFTALIHQLGASPSRAFADVLSLDDAELLAMIPRPALALILVFPTSGVYEEDVIREDAARRSIAGVVRRRM
jgi:ubiquitin carboxyl-terminal hydrolase L3